MKNRITIITILSVATVILSIATFVMCIVLNFTEFNMGNLATLKNMIVTFSYLSVWILVLIVGIISKKSGIILYSSVFWFITLFTAIALCYHNVTGNLANLIIPVILFIGQWYGLGFFISSILYQSIVIALISLVMLIITVISVKRTKLE